MIYNNGVKFGKIIEEPSQGEIYSCPEYFAMSREEIEADEGCPPFLRRILGEFPFDGRPNVVQVRPQDFRSGYPILIGDHWHTDVLVRLNDKRVRVAKHAHEFHLMVASWGNVVETEFMTEPTDMPDLFTDKAFGPVQLLSWARLYTGKTQCAEPGQLVEYTSTDIHRVPGNSANIGRCRLLIIAFDCDEYMAGGKKLQSIAEKDLGIGLKFEDYTLGVKTS
jgi:hypothetical protein